MTNKLLKWIRKCSNLPDTQLEEYLNTIHGNSINSFLQAIDKTSTNGKRDFPAVIYDLNLAGKNVTLTLQEEGIPQSVYHNDNREQLTIRIKQYQSALALNSISNFKILLLRKHIGQDLVDIYDTFENQLEFYSYCKQQFGWEKAMYRLYSNYYQFIEDYPMFLYSGIGWTQLRNRNIELRKWLESPQANGIPIDDKSSPSFWMRIC
jgi:hypothetical protein